MSVHKPHWAKAAFFVIAVVVASQAVAAADAPLRFGNEFIQIIVNPGPEEAGRFGVETTGGDPSTPADDSMPLIYGRPMPWTSYTTVRIDDTDWVFGGKTTRRAGRSGRYGEQLIAPRISGSTIETSYRTGDIVVTQQLSLVKSPTTRYLDTARIHYIVENTATVTRRVGLRLLIDTMLGGNDGAPLRAGDEALVSDMLFEGRQIPEYWQAFDSIVSPSVTSQGTLRGGELTTPDRLAFSNWGAFAERLWDADIVPGREFIRAREQDLDSAVALYWSPVDMAPGEVRHYVTYYGIGGITLAPGHLALGITAPSQVSLSAQGTGLFTAVAYVSNTGEGPAHDVSARIRLPRGFSLAPGQSAVKALGDLEPAAVGQAAWQVVVDWAAAGGGEISVEANANNADGNNVSRRVDVLSPPRMLASIRRVEAVENRGEVLYPWPIRAVLRVENTGGSPAYWVRASLDSPGGLSLIGGANREVLLGTLESGQYHDVVYTLGGSPAPGEQRIAMSAIAQNAPASLASASVQIPRLVPKVWAKPSVERAPVGDIVHVDVMVTNVPDARNIQFDIVYDGLLTYAMCSRGDLNASQSGFASWSEGDAWSKPGKIERVQAGLVPSSNGIAWGSAASVYFVASKQGTSRVHIENVVLLDSQGKEIILEQAPASCMLQVAGRQ